MKKPTVEEIRRVEKLIYRGAKSFEAVKDCARIEELFDDLEKLLTSWIVTGKNPDGEDAEEVTEAVLLKWYEKRNELTVQISDLIKRTGVDDGALNLGTGLKASDRVVDGLTASERRRWRDTDPRFLILKFIRGCGKDGADMEALLGLLEEHGYTHGQSKKYLDVFHHDGTIFLAKGDKVFGFRSSK